MGYDVFSKRCGCGAIHPVRSTCPACIDRKRAEAVAKAGPDQAGSKPGGWITRANTMLDPVKPVAERSGQADALRYAFPDGLRAWLPEPALEFESTRIPLPGGLKLDVGADQPFDLRPHVGWVQLYSGKRPPSHKHVPAGRALLFEAAPGDDAMTLASGIATFARLWGKDRRTALCDMSVSTTGGGGQVQLSTTRIPSLCELALNFDKIECTRDQAREMGLDVGAAPKPVERDAKQCTEIGRIQGALVGTSLSQLWSALHYVERNPLCADGTKRLVRILPKGCTGILQASPEDVREALIEMGVDKEGNLTIESRAEPKPRTYLPADYPEEAHELLRQFRGVSPETVARRKACLNDQQRAMIEHLLEVEQEELKRGR